MGKSGKILILNYHLVANEEIQSRTTSDPFYNVGVETFRAQMQIINDFNIPVITLSNLINGEFKEEFGIALTFDDGYTSDIEIVLPILSALNFSATFFPFLNCIGQPGRATWQQLRKLSDLSFEIGSHGVSHTVFSKLSSADQEKELRFSKSILEKQLGITINHFSLPYGWYTNKIIENTKNAGYLSVLTTGLQMNNSENKPFLLHRWNIKRDTSIDIFRKILQLKGRLPVHRIFLSFSNRFIRRIFGPVFTDTLHVLYKKFR
ncbi:polysaccharide deacetylase family protein [soil metagenome]